MDGRRIMWEPGAASAAGISSRDQQPGSAAGISRRDQQPGSAAGISSRDQQPGLLAGIGRPPTRIGSASRSISRGQQAPQVPTASEIRRGWPVPLLACASPGLCLSWPVPLPAGASENRRLLRAPPQETSAPFTSSLKPVRCTLMMFTERSSLSFLRSLAMYTSMLRPMK